MSASSPLLRRPHRGGRLRRAVAASLALLLALGLLAVPSSGDEIDDLRSEAERVADRIEELQHESEVLTESYLDARLERERFDDEIVEATERADESGADLEVLADQLRTVAVDSYVSDSTTASASVLGASDPTALTVAQGYVDAVGLDGDDLLDAYRGQERRAGRDAEDLARLRDEALAAEEQADADRQATEDMIAELQELEASIDDDLRALVEEEQRRREEQQLAAAAAAAEEAEREQQAPAPAPSASAEDDPADTPDAPATTEAPTRPRATEPAPAPEPTAPAPGASSGAEAAIAAARRMLGVPYRWAGASPSGGFDCSGLTMWAWSHGGRSLPHSSRAQYAMARKIPVSQLQPGDLVFYNSPISHVGLYIGGGQMIHAPRTGKNVEIQSIHYWSALVGGGRI